MALRQLKAENILASGKRLGPADISPKLRDGRPARPTRRVLRAALERCFHRGPRGNQLQSLWLDTRAVG
jgi:hypothetical protein